MVRQYVGAGVLGELAARMDAEDRQRREDKAAAWREERERLEELAGLVEEFDQDVETIVRAALLAAGFRRHNRGEWRRPRDRETGTEE